MTQKIIKIGKSSGITIPKELLQASGLRVGDKVVVEADKKGQVFTIRPSSEVPERRGRVADLTDRFISRYRQDLENLADR